MSYEIKLKSEAHAHSECISYLGASKYEDFITRLKTSTAGMRITKKYRAVSFACMMVGMRGYWITRAVFRDVIKK